MTQPIWNEASQEIEIDLRYYFHILKNSWKLITATASGAMFVALAISSFLQPAFRATATLYIDAAQTTDGSTINDIRTSESLARTYAEMLQSRPVLLDTIDSLDLDSQNIGPNALRGKISANPVASTQLLRVQVEDSDSGRAADIANAVSEALIRELDHIQTGRYVSAETRVQARLDLLDTQIAESRAALADLSDNMSDEALSQRTTLENSLSDLDREYSIQLSELREVRVDVANSAPVVELFELAIPSNNPVSPNIVLNTLVGFILGLMAAVGFVFARELLNTTVRDPDELSRKFGVPILGQILNFEADTDKLITATQPRTPAAESFRALRLNLKYSSVDKTLRSILITSASPSEGKSTVASNLSAAMALGGQDTILIDGDMRRPRVHNNLGLLNQAGLSDLFIESVDALSQMVQPTTVKGLSAIVAGPTPPNPSELLDTAKSKLIIDTAAEHAAMVIIDAPPIAAMTDAVALSQYVDGVVLVVRAGSTTKGSVEHAVQRLRQVNANLLGFAITDIDNVFSKGAYYYSYYGGYNDAYTKYFDSDDDDKADSGTKNKSSDKKSSKRKGSKSKQSAEVKSTISGWIVSLFR